MSKIAFSLILFSLTGCATTNRANLDPATNQLIATHAAKELAFVMPSARFTLAQRAGDPFGRTLERWLYARARLLPGEIGLTYALDRVEENLVLIRLKAGPLSLSTAYTPAGAPAGPWTINDGGGNH